MNIVYLFGTKADRSYFILVVFLIFIGTLTGSELMWEINDLSNGFMVIPNVLALFVLTDMVKNAGAGLKK
jgi:AGCS family alanine or glycine:cation symporter